MKISEDVPLHLQRSVVALSSAQKQGTLFCNASGSGGKWKKGWFVLDGNRLFWFLSEVADRPKSVLVLENLCVECEDLKDAAQKYVLKLVAQKEKSLGDSGAKASPVLLCAPNEPARKDWLRAINSALQSDSIAKYGSKVDRLIVKCAIRVTQVKLTDELERDTCCVILADSHIKGRSLTVFNEKRPLYNMEAEFDVNPATRSLIFQVKEFTKKGDQILGHCVLPFREQGFEDEWYELVKSDPTLAADSAGFLIVNIFTAKSQSALKVQLVEGRNLMACDDGCSDPFVQISYGDQKKFTSPVKKRNLDPSWKKETATFALEGNDVNLVLEVIDNVTQTVMGRVSLNRDEINHCNGRNVKLNLFAQVDSTSKASDVIGKIRLDYSVKEIVVFPNKMYEPLFSVAISDKFDIASVVSRINFAKEKAVFETLVKSFDMKHSAVHFLKNQIRQELEVTKDPAILFRGNSPCTKSMDTYMRLAGATYIQHVFKSVVDTIISNSVKQKKSCEMDPVKLTCDPALADKVLAKNLVTLTGYLDLILSAILSSLPVAPSTFRNLFVFVKECVQKAFPDKPQVVYPGISGFLFLRFFCPALLTPRSFAIIDDDPSALINRDLMLIVKTLQNLANVVVFGKKETFMTPLNDWLNANTDKLKKIIDEIASIPSKPVDELPNMKKTNWGLQMAVLHKYLKEIPLNQEGDDKDAQIVKLNEEIANLDEKIEAFRQENKNRPLERKQEDEDYFALESYWKIKEVYEEVVPTLVLPSSPPDEKPPDTKPALKISVSNSNSRPASSSGIPSLETSPVATPLTSTSPREDFDLRRSKEGRKSRSVGPKDDGSVSPRTAFVEKSVKARNEKRGRRLSLNEGSGQSTSPTPSPTPSPRQMYTEDDKLDKKEESKEKLSAPTSPRAKDRAASRDLTKSASGDKVSKRKGTSGTKTPEKGERTEKIVRQESDKSDAEDKKLEGIKQEAKCDGKTEERQPPSPHKMSFSNTFFLQKDIK